MPASQAFKCLQLLFRVEAVNRDHVHFGHSGRLPNPDFKRFPPIVGRQRLFALLLIRMPEWPLQQRCGKNKRRQQQGGRGRNNRNEWILLVHVWQCRKTTFLQLLVYLAELLLKLRN